MQTELCENKMTSTMLPIPDSVHWVLAGTCNLNCRFCYGPHRPGYLSLQDKLNIIEKIAAAGVRRIAITGGEPLLDSDVFAILERSSKLGLYTSLHTNGVLLDTTARKKILGIVDRLSIALDGSTEEMCYDLRGHHGFFKWTLDILEWARQEQQLVTIKTVATSKNIHDLLALNKLLHEYLSYNPKNLWFISEFLPIRGAYSNRNELMLNRELFEDFRKNLLPSPFIILCKTNDEIEQSPYFFINASGDVFTWDPIGKEEITVGNLLQIDVTEAWQNIQTKFCIM
ncbi:MAG: radical SAM protein [Oligoflexia bacterium]|nr:radical SAM protein [Oligoflexia bacterium]